jgi:predicted nucleic acid-binding protein
MELTRQELFEYAHQLAALAVKVDFEASDKVFNEVLDLAERYQLTTYDASYLELAQRRGLTIATTDANLVRAAAAVKAPVLNP